MHGCVLVLLVPSVQGDVLHHYLRGVLQLQVFSAKFYLQLQQLSHVASPWTSHSRKELLKSFIHVALCVIWQCTTYQTFRFQNILTEPASMASHSLTLLSRGKTSRDLPRTFQMTKMVRVHWLFKAHKNFNCKICKLPELLVTQNRLLKKKVLAVTSSAYKYRRNTLLRTTSQQYSYRTIPSQSNSKAITK